MIRSEHCASVVTVFAYEQYSLQGPAGNQGDAINRVIFMQQRPSVRRHFSQSLGGRGFHKLSRSMNFGFGDTVSELRRQANDNLMLWGQVETLPALQCLTE